MVRPWCLGGGRQTQHWRLNRWRPNPCFPPWASGADPHRVPRHRSGSRRARRLHNEDRAGRMAQDVAAGTAARRPSPPLIRADHDRMCSGCRSHLQDGRCRIAHHDATLRSNPTLHGRGGSWPAVAVRIGRRGWSRAGGWPRSAGSPRPSPPARWHAPRRGEPPRSGRWPAAAGGPGGRRAASNRCGAVPSHALIRTMVGVWVARYGRWWGVWVARQVPTDPSREDVWHHLGGAATRRSSRIGPSRVVRPGERVPFGLWMIPR